MNNHVIGEKLKELRTEAGYTTGQVARYLDHNMEQVEMWEAGESQPNVEQMLVLSYLYGISMNELLYEINPVELVAGEIQEEYCHEAWLNRLCQKSC